PAGRFERELPELDFGRFAYEPGQEIHELPGESGLRLFAVGRVLVRVYERLELLPRSRIYVAYRKLVTAGAVFIAPECELVEDHAVRAVEKPPPLGIFPLAIDSGNREIPELRSGLRQKI